MWSLEGILVICCWIAKRYWFKTIYYYLSLFCKLTRLSLAISLVIFHAVAFKGCWGWSHQTVLDIRDGPCTHRSDASVLFHMVSLSSRVAWTSYRTQKRKWPWHSLTSPTTYWPKQLKANSNSREWSGMWSKEGGNWWHHHWRSDSTAGAHPLGSLLGNPPFEARRTSALSLAEIPD